jgi:hypothetical protein
MSFLHPWALALIALAAVPLLLHLVRRETRRRVPFPALRYLQSAERQNARSMRIRDWLLALVRVAVVLLLAAAASRPLVGRGEAGSHLPTDLILLLDNTASMARLSGDSSLLDAARAGANLTLERLGPEDRVWLVTPVDGVAVAGGTAEDAARALESIRGSDASGSIPDAIQLTTSAVPSIEGRVRELQLLTDLQAGSFSGSAELDDGVSVRILQLVPDAAGNGAVTTLEVGPSTPVPPGSAVTVTARLTMWGNTEDPDPPGDDQLPGEVDIRLLLDGRTAGIQTVAWGSDVVFSIPAPTPGSHVVRVEIDPSGLRADDGRQSGFRVADAARVAFHRGIDPDGSFLEYALETLETDGRIALSTAGPVDVAVRVGPGTRERGVARGAGREPSIVLVPPLDALALPAFNQELSSLGVPWRAEVDSGSGALRIDGRGLPGLDDQLVSRRYGLQAIQAPRSAADSILLRTSDGEPWVVRGEVGGSMTYVLLASPLHPEATGLPVSIAMVEFIDALVNRWARPGDPPGSRQAGEQTALPPRADSLAGPSGRAERVEGGAPWRPRLTGSWRLTLRTAGGTASRFIGVNVPESESDPTPIGAARLSRVFDSNDVRVVQTESDWKDAIFVRRRGRDLRPVLIAIALLALALEAFLAAPRRSRSAAAPEAHA